MSYENPKTISSKFHHSLEFLPETKLFFPKLHFNYQIPRACVHLHRQTSSLQPTTPASIPCLRLLQPSTTTQLHWIDSNRNRVSQHTTSKLTGNITSPRRRSTPPETLTPRSQPLLDFQFRPLKFRSPLICHRSWETSHNHQFITRFRTLVRRFLINLVY